VQSGNRAPVQVYYDLLRATHVLVKAGRRPTMYRVGRLAGLPHARLKVRLAELRDLGLIIPGVGVTDKGYQFCEDYLKKIAPVFQKYGLGRPEMIRAAILDF
jgi:hypothetical protein